MKIVLALGGNALQSNPKDKSAESQLATCVATAKSIVKLVEAGHNIIIVHGNGPQVGQLLASFECAHNSDNANPVFPLDVVDAISQGYIGYHLQQAIKNELSDKNLAKNVQTLLTQVIVDPNDERFKNPTKPIGSFYSEEDAKKLASEKGYIMKEDAGRGYRRVVPSPLPIDIVEKKVIRSLYADGNIVITCGGGGIPVIRNDESLDGVAAVIDKDLAAEKLAEVVDADLLLILTCVDGVFINYNTPEQEKLSDADVATMEGYIAENQFASGSMLPKVEACLKFVKQTDKKAIIASLEQASEAIAGKAGTVIHK